MATRSGDASSSSSRAERKNAYQRVVETVKQQTGGEQSALVSESHVRVTAVANGSLETDAFKTGLRAAIEQGELVEWHGQLVAAEPERLRAAVLEEADADHPRRGLIGRLNTRLAELSEGDDE